MLKQYRQGDVLFIEISRQDYKSFKKFRKEDNIIIEGEATGHAHRLENGLLSEGWRGMFIDAELSTKVVHEEHNTIFLPKGFYRVEIQKEYTGNNQSQYVLD
jgi:capsular polysaccharide biosynthesis protein